MPLIPEIEFIFHPPTPPPPSSGKVVVVKYGTNRFTPRVMSPQTAEIDTGQDNGTKS